MNVDIFKNLLELNADEWNTMVSAQLGIPVEILKNTFNMRQTLSMTEDKVKLNVDQLKLDSLAKESSREYETKVKWASEDVDEKNKYVPPQDRFVNKTTNESSYEVTAFACIGKVIVGVDFSQCGLEKSLFNGCTFFNCIFDNASFDSSTFLNCTFNVCDMSNLNCTRVQFSRCRFIDSTFDRAIVDYSIFTDCMIIACQFINASLMYANFSYTGLNECSFAQSTLRDSTFCVSSIISTNLSDASFRNSKLLDVALLRCDCTGTDFLGVQYNSISAQEIAYDGPYTELFLMSREVFSPAIREWENSGSYDENEVDDFVDGLDLGDDSFDDIMGNDDDDDDDGDRDF